MKSYWVYGGAAGCCRILGTVEASAEDRAGKYPGARQKAEAIWGRGVFVVCRGHVAGPRMGNGR